MPVGSGVDKWGTLVYYQNYVNGMCGQSYGAELAANYTVTERWRMQLAYTYIDLFLHNEPGDINYLNPSETPSNQVYLQSSWDLGNHWKFDLTGRYVDSIVSPTGGPIPSYIVFDTRLAWQARKNLELSVAGRNLGNGHYAEFTPIVSTTTYKVGPEVYGQITWRY